MDINSTVKYYVQFVEEAIYDSLRVFDVSLRHKLYLHKPLFRSPQEADRTQDSRECQLR